MNEYGPLKEIGLAFVCALGLGLMIQPGWIRIARHFGWLDLPRGRKQHLRATPLMGGVGIFAATLLAVGGIGGRLLWEDQSLIWICGTGLVLVGMYDDLKGMQARIKLNWQLVIAMVAGLGGFRLESLLGLGSLESFPLIWQMPMTLIFLIAITNAYNMLDGMDGVAAGLGTTTSLLFGILFLFNGDRGFALLAFGLAGGLLAFWYYNRAPAQLFMGDAGSLFIGFLLGLFALRFLQQGHVWLVESATQPIIVFAILIVPITDITQVMAYRLSIGKSPLSADRNHIHHLLLQAGWNAEQIPWILIGVTLLMLAISLLGIVIDMNMETLLLVQLGGAYWAAASIRGKETTTKWGNGPARP